MSWITLPVKNICLALLFIIPGSVILYLIILFNTQYLFGYVDNKGHFVIPPKYIWADDFHDGVAKVDESTNKSCKGYMSYTIDRMNNILRIDRGSEYSCKVLDIDFGSIYPFYTQGGEPYPDKIQDSQGFLEYGFKDKNNKWIIPPKFSDAIDFHNGVAWVVPFESKEQLWGLINKKGQYVLPPKCMSAGNFHEGLAFCRVKVIFGIFY